MLLLLTIGLVIITLILVLHYHQHFHLQCSRVQNISSFQTANQTEINIMQIVKCKKLCFTLIPHDGEKYNLFPYSFLFYLAFMALLCIFIIITEVSEFFYNTTNNETVVDLLLGYSIESYHNNSFDRLHQIQGIHIMDYIVIYSIMLSCVWQSSFSFYRYYTMFFATKQLTTISTKKVMKTFLIYAITFCIIFSLQIHLSFWIFPIIILLFFGFNTYCCYSFSAMLLDRCKFFADLDLGDDTNTNQEIIQNVKLTKIISLITCVLQCINLSLFLITYNINITYFLPILWSISSFTLALNFARTRKFLTAYKYICFLKNKRQNSVRNVIVHSYKPKVTDKKNNYVIEKAPDIKSITTAETEIVSDTQYIHIETDNMNKTNILPQTHMKTSKSWDIFMRDTNTSMQNESIPTNGPILFRRHTDP
eukprot:31778_1